MSDFVLHYVHDPLCGWCYAVTPLVETIAKAGIPILLHGGGLWGAGTHLSSDKRDYIRRNDRRISELTGMTFGAAYLDGLLMDEHTVLWSRPTISAVLAAGTISAGADLRMMRAIQHAHYVEGRRVVERPVLITVAAAIGLPGKAFEDAFDAAPVDKHIAATRRLMAQAGLGGFPGFLMERGNKMIRVPHEAFYGHPEKFLGSINTLAAASFAA